MVARASACSTVVLAYIMARLPVRVGVVVVSYRFAFNANWPSTLVDVVVCASA